MTLTPVFTCVRADLSAEFVSKFPKSYDFSGMLQEICKEAGVKLICTNNIEYVLQGEWGPMGQVHDHLTYKLWVCCSSVAVGPDKCKPVIDHAYDDQGSSFGISLLYSASQIADSNISKDVVSSFTVSLEDVPNPVDQRSWNHDDPLQLQLAKCKHSVDNKYDKELKGQKDATQNINHHNNIIVNKATCENVDTENADDDGCIVNNGVNSDVENNTQCDGIKIKIESKSFLNNDSEEISNKESKDRIPNLETEKPGKNEVIVKRGRGRPRKLPLKTDDITCTSISKKICKSSDNNDIPKKSLYTVRREKIHKKYKTGIKWKMSMMNNKIQTSSDLILRKRKRGRPKKDPEQVNLQCHKCDFIAKSRNQLGDHKRRIHFATPSKCDICNKIFPNARYMRRHRSSHVQPQHCCDVCGKMYKILKALKDHRKTHEVGYKKPEFPCDMCSKTFCTRYILECHCKSEHFGQRKSFLCSICGKSFTTKHTLIQHSNLHTGSRPYVCDICDKSFAYESALRDHKFIHKQEKIFSCEICQKSFSQRSALKMHEKIHKEKKDFTCAECGRGFTQKQALQRHERAHKGDKPFCCKLCGRTFGDASIIRRHMILVHKIHKDSKTWREDIIARGKAVNSQPIKFYQDEQTFNTKNSDQNFDKEESTDESTDSLHTGNTHDPNFQKLPEGHLTNLSHVSSSVPVHIDSTARSLHSVHSMVLSQDVRPSQAHTTSQVSSLYTVEPVTPMNYHISTDLVDTNSSYKFTLSTQPGTSTEVTSSEQYQASPNVSRSRTLLPRVDSVLSKRLTEMEPPENLSISSIYTYYTNLASQCINGSQYQGYVSSQEGLPSTDQH